MTIGNRIRALRVSHSMSSRELGERLGISETGERYWETGARKPSTDAIVSLANIFDVSTDYILGVNADAQSPTPEELRLLSQYRTLDQHGKDVINSLLKIELQRVPRDYTESIKPSRIIPMYITPAAAGCSFPLSNDDFELISANNDVPTNASFAVKIQGNSMLPKIQDGDTVFVQKDAILSDGDIGIFNVDGSMYCKQYYKENNGNIHLKSLNPEYSHTDVKISADSNSEFRCFGKVLLR